MSQVEDFIEEVKKHPCLYDRSERNFQNNDAREVLWAELGASFNLDAKRKWLSLRERYTKEKRKIELCGPDGANKIYIWPYFWSLQFLNDHIVTRKPSDKKVSNKISRMEDFINDVREHEVLYNKKNPEYVNKQLREEIWQEISEKYNVDAKIKFQFLRERFNRERKKMEAKAEVTGIYLKPRWAFYTSMEFIGEHVMNRGPRKYLNSSNTSDKDATQIYMTEETPTLMFYKDEEEDDDDDPLFKIDPDFEEAEIRDYPARKNIKLDENDELMVTLNDIQNKLSNKMDEDILMTTLTDIQMKLSTKAEEEEDEDWLFLRSLRVKMRKMPNAAKRTFKINMLIQADEATGDM